jgi:hypothetical protein
LALPLGEGAAAAAEAAEVAALRAQVAALEAARRSDAERAASKRAQRKNERSTSPHTPGGRRDELANLRKELQLQKQACDAMKAQHAVMAQLVESFAKERRERDAARGREGGGEGAEPPLQTEQHQRVGGEADSQTDSLAAEMA